MATLDRTGKGIRMKMTRILTICAVLLIPVGLVLRAQTQQAAGPAAPGLTLTTTAFDDGSVIPPKFTQADANPISPKLQWTNVPPTTVSFVLIFHDPDVALDKKTDDFLHWLAFNIPGAVRELPEGVPPNAQLADGTIQAKNTRGGVGYRGPGAGAAGPYHHYTFELFALDMKLDLGADATRADILKAIDGHILGKAVLVGRFHR
jgi:Raf kinase inhibitor-like YbhB/YbcL family protein